MGFVSLCLATQFRLKPRLRLTAIESEVDKTIALGELNLCIAATIARTREIQ